MSYRFLTILGGFALSFASIAQTTKSALDARDLYLEPVGETNISTVTLAAGNTREQSRDLKRSQPSGAQVRNLGIRYNVLLLDPTNSLPQPVDPEGAFKTGDCIVLELQTNRAGHLYVLAEGASREWVTVGKHLQEVVVVGRASLEEQPRINA